MKRKILSVAILILAIITNLLFSYNLYARDITSVASENSSRCYEAKINLVQQIKYVQNTVVEKGIAGIEDTYCSAMAIKDSNKKKKKEEKKKVNKWDIELSSDETKLLAKILWVEARGESDEGQQAVIEVVLNRTIHKAFKGSLEDVLSSKNQFCSWKLRNTAEPTEKEYKNIKTVIDGETDILDFDTVYFSTSPRNKDITIHIGGHYFCRCEK